MAKVIDPATGPAVWTGVELSQNDDWIIKLTPSDLKELNTAVMNIQRRNIPVQEITTNDFHGAIPPQKAWFMNPNFAPDIIGAAALLKYVKEKNQLDSVMTLSPLTPMATHYHIRNGAKLIKINPTTQNFEYKI